MRVDYKFFFTLMRCQSRSEPVDLNGVALITAESEIFEKNSACKRFRRIACGIGHDTS